MNGKRMTFHTPEEELGSFERKSKVQRTAPKNHDQPCLTRNLTEDFDYMRASAQRKRDRDLQIYERGERNDSP